MVGASDLIVQVLCKRHFLEEQGHKVDSNTIYQYNKKMKWVLSERKCYMDIRCLFYVHKVPSGEIVMENCHTNKIILDFYTNQFQGRIFKEYRDLILNDNQKQSVSQSIK